MRLPQRQRTPLRNDKSIKNSRGGLARGSIITPIAIAFFPTGRMAAHAVIEILDAFLPVFIFNFSPIVFVAAIAGIVADRAGMAGAATARAAPSMIKREAMALIECCWDPG